MWTLVALTIAVCALLAALWRLNKVPVRGFSAYSNQWEDPVTIKEIITPDECQYIIKKTEPNFSRSVTVEGADQTRTSDTAWISKDDPVARKILQKACELTGKTLENCEDIQVVRYNPGTFYKPHHDSCCDNSQKCREFEARGGQRVGTLLVYLNDAFTEGETHFPNNGDIKMKVDPGNGIFFRPLDSDDSKCHPKALHAGLPVSSGIKYICNAWVREGEFK
jgi:prolyl 4-hydroxylase